MNLQNQTLSVAISAQTDNLPWASMSGVNTTPESSIEPCGEALLGLEAWGLVRTSLIVLLSVATCVTNFVVIVILRLNDGLHSVSGTFTSGVAIADLFIGLLIIPPNVLDSSYPDVWNNSRPMYYVWVTLDYFLSITSILSMILLNLDRFWSITYPIKYIRLRTKRHAIMMIAIIWGIVFVIVIPFAITWKYVYPDAEPVSARSNFVQYGAASWYFATGSVFVFVIPLCITCAMYFHIIKAIQKRSTMAIGRMSAGSMASKNSKKDSENAYSLVSQSDIWHLQSLYDSAVNSPTHSAAWNNRYIVNNRSVGCYASIDEEAESDDQEKKSKAGSSLEGEQDDFSLFESGRTMNHKVETTVGSSSTSGVSKEPSGCVEASTLEVADSEIVVTQAKQEILSVTNLSQAENIHHVCQNGRPNGVIPITAAERDKDRKLKVDNTPVKSHIKNGDVRSSNNNSNTSSQTQKRISQRYLTRQGLSDSWLPRNGHTTRRMRGKLSLPQGTDDHPLQIRPILSLRQSASSPQLPSTTSSPMIPNHTSSNGHATLLGNKRRDIKRNGDYFASNPSFRGSTGSVRARLRHSLTGLSGRGSKVLLILKRAQKAAKQLGVILTCFLICWMPYFAQVIVYAICPNCTKPKLMTIAVYMGYVHSLCNPILYITFNLRFRKAFQKVICPCYTPRRWYHKQALRHGSREHQLSRLYSEAQL
ncbi:histamine H1 receptor-like [Anneissia japonica]|uniref:histamine H1 receptor-like n=1 Tax=Anneissia japonica TaxID=1529436 RepID=UPI001425523A|nr:histamine H1 receptor-like [Anneissia japonica]